jgi:uncharacterized protein (TIGR02598 family)
MKRRQETDSFSLVEVTLALGVAAFSLTVIFALLPVGLHTVYTATEQSASTDIMTSVIADLRATPPTSPRGGTATSTQFGIDVPNASGSGSPITLYFDSEGQLSPSPNAARYRLTLTFPANTSGSRAATFVDLKMTWPAPANPTNASGSAAIFVALDRN